MIQTIKYWSNSGSRKGKDNFYWLAIASSMPTPFTCMYMCHWHLHNCISHIKLCIKSMFFWMSIPETKGIRNNMGIIGIMVRITSNLWEVLEELISRNLSILSSCLVVVKINVITAIFIMSPSTCNWCCTAMSIDCTISACSIIISIIIILLCS